ncbi:hypothetical protein Ciccas_012791 [Cichlidogyrus casuarinus]|uniref:Fibronectin type-III domain-containing protein n=1 Tax=Cichlidogyrus casuarinus TaxID=1844966 RepID=A0ABD2PMW1_9PLAT
MKVLVDLYQKCVFSKDSAHFVVYSWTPAAVAVDTRTLTHTISNVKQIDLNWTNPNSTVARNCQQNTLIEYYVEGYQKNTRSITTHKTQVTLDNLADYQYYFVRFNTTVVSKIRPDETDQILTPEWTKIGPTAPGGWFSFKNMTLKAPGKVTNLRSQQTNEREVKISWQPPEIKNGPIDGYHVEDIRKQFEFNTRETSIKVDGLEPCSAYTFFVFAYKNGTERGIGGGNGPKDSLDLYLVFTGDFAPDEITTTQKYKGKVVITWANLLPRQCKAEYRVYIDDKMMGKTVKELFTVNDLEGNKTYTLQIAAQVGDQVEYSDYKFFDVPAYREFLWSQTKNPFRSRKSEKSDV